MVLRIFCVDALGNVLFFNGSVGLSVGVTVAETLPYGSILLVDALKDQSRAFRVAFPVLYATMLLCRIYQFVFLQLYDAKIASFRVTQNTTILVTTDEQFASSCQVCLFVLFLSCRRCPSLCLPLN